MGMMFILASQLLTPPDTPTLLAIDEICEEGGINCYYQLSWSGTDPNDTYRIYQDGVFYDTSNSESYSAFNPISDAETGCWSVSAVNASTIEGSQSTCVSWVVPPAKVTGLSADALNNEHINVSWDALPVGTVTSYEINYAFSNIGPWYLLASPTFTTYNHTGLLSSTTYWYRVRGRNGAVVSSEWSDTAFATTLACFVEGTMITLSDGNERPIEELNVGDVLLSAGLDGFTDTNDVELLYEWNDVNLSTNKTSSEISSINSKEALGTIIINDGLIEATPSHSQLRQHDGIWKFDRFDTLEVGDKLYDKNNEIIEIISIEHNEDIDKIVYPMTLSGPHTYYANGILTHNIK